MSDDELFLPVERPKARVVRVETRTTPYVHYLDNLEARTFLQGVLSQDLYEDLLQSPRPVSSRHPDEIESQSIAQVKRRREQRFSGMDTGGWVLKNLYEETFAVLPDYALGGLISHHYRRDSRALLGHVRSIDSDILSFSDAEGLRKLKENQEAGRSTRAEYRTMVQMIAHVGVPTNDPHGQYTKERLKIKDQPGKPGDDPETLLQREDFKDSFGRGWLFLQGLHAFETELFQASTDDRVINEFIKARVVGVEITHSQEMILDRAWESLSRLVFHQGSVFKPTSELDLGDAIRKLAVLRASPKFAFLYSHFTAEGAIKDRLSHTVA